MTGDVIDSVILLRTTHTLVGDFNTVISQNITAANLSCIKYHYDIYLAGSIAEASSKNTIIR
jgi:hypothetical protein